MDAPGEVEGRDDVLVERHGEAKEARLPDLAREPAAE